MIGIVISMHLDKKRRKKEILVENRYISVLLHIHNFFFNDYCAIGEELKSFVWQNQFFSIEVVKKEENLLGKCMNVFTWNSGIFFL